MSRHLPCLSGILLRLVCCALPLSLPFDLQAQAPVTVHLSPSSSRGYLNIRSEAGTLIGSGDYSQRAPVGNANRITTRLTLHFRDGSLDEETTIYTEDGIMRLVSDHHVQHGPFFSKPLDMLIEGEGQVTTRDVGKPGPDGKPAVEINHIDLPPDISNGMVGAVLLNKRADAPLFTLGLIAPAGKPRLIKLAVQTMGTTRFLCSPGQPGHAGIFQIRPELGGLTAVIAPLVGRQPGDSYIYIAQGDVPQIVREVGALTLGGSVVSLELAGTSFAPATQLDLPALHRR